MQGITFISAGAATSPVLLRDGLLPRLAAATRHTSFSFLWQPGMGWEEARLLAAAIHDLAAATAGAASFRFGVAFGCPPGIPFFPVAAAGEQAGFAIGTENGGLLYEAFRRAAAGAASAPAAAAAALGAASSGPDADSTAGRCHLATARSHLEEVMVAALRPVEALAQQLAAAHGRPYLGLDASIAPALEPPTLTDAYELVSEGRGCLFWHAALHPSQVSGWKSAVLWHARLLYSPAVTAGATTQHTAPPPTPHPLGMPPSAPGGGDLQLGLGRFGGGGTLAVSEAITAALKALPLQLTGYSGLMLPVCEDRGLAQAALEGRLTLRSLLAFSAVGDQLCGGGGGGLGRGDGGARGQPR